MSQDAFPLDGVKVIELAHVMAGPTCGRMLADMGADVIKLERPGGGDDSRRMAPPWVGEDSAAFLMLNRNKRSISLDLKSSAGREAFLALIDTVDVLIENFRPGALARLELDAPPLLKRNPRLVFCSITGFGASGPYAQRGGFDLIAQGMSGLMAITGEGPGRPPVKCGAPVADITAGVLAAMGVCAKLHQRHQTGRGGVVDTSLYEAAVMHTFWQSAMHLADGREPAAMGSAHPLDAPYQAFEASDGWFNLGAANQANWERTARAIGRPGLIDDPRFKNNPARMENLDALIAELAPVFKTEPRHVWLERLDAAGVPCGPIHAVSEMIADPHTAERAMVTAGPDGQRTLGMPVKFDGPVNPVRRAAPRMGEHTADVLAEAGLPDAAIQAILGQSRSEAS
ncbi:MAG: CaiB/BaiF CoA transferase family protein [Oceanicaulis sp.]